MFKKFHPEHFVCSYCLKQLKKGTFKEQGDKPYCHGCFERLFGWWPECLSLFSKNTNLYRLHSNSFFFFNHPDDASVFFIHEEKKQCYIWRTWRTKTNDEASHEITFYAQKQNNDSSKAMPGLWGVVVKFFVRWEIVCGWRESALLRQNGMNSN